MFWMVKTYWLFLINFESNYSMKQIHNILSTIIKPWAVQAAGQPFVYFEYNPVGDNTRVYSSVTNDWERTLHYNAPVNLSSGHL